MMNRVLVDAFGMAEDRRRSKNEEARELCDGLTRTIEAIKKSKHNLQRLAELQAKLHEDGLTHSRKHRKVVNYAAHRWGSINRVFEVVLVNWKLIEEEEK